MTLALRHVHLHVPDLAAAEAFLRDALGLTVKQRFGAHLAFLSDGHGMDLALMEDPGVAPLPPWFHLGCRLASASAVREQHARLAGCNLSVSEVGQNDAGYVTFAVLGPSGLQVELYHDPVLAEPGDGESA